MEWGGPWRGKTAVHRVEKWIREAGGKGGAACNVRWAPTLPAAPTSRSMRSARLMRPPKRCNCTAAPAAARADARLPVNLLSRLTR